MPGAEPREIQARDGYRLGATLFHPASGNGRALQINAAAGVKQEYYGKFAAYLAERGFTVLTFDYRGIGRSGHWKLNARMRDWAELDAGAALQFLSKTGNKLMAVGHSFGGQSFALIPGAERLAAALAVGSQSGYWRHWRGAPRAGMWLLTHALLPGISRLFGYFPAAALGQGENIPAGVAIEWASWCRHPDYLVGALGAKEQYARFSGPLRLFPRAVPRYLVARCRRLAGKVLNENARGQGRRRHRRGERAGTRHGARLRRRRHARRARGRR